MTLKAHYIYGLKNVARTLAFFSHYKLFRELLTLDIN